eukprot:g1868.t1
MASANAPAKAQEADEAAAVISDVQLYVGNLPTTVQTQQLTDAFAKYGELTDSFVSVRNGRHRGFGFVTFKEPRDAKKALEATSGKPLLEGHKGMRVVFANKRPEGKVFNANKQKSSSKRKGKREGGGRKATGASAKEGNASNAAATKEGKAKAKATNKAAPAAAKAPPAAAAAAAAPAAAASKPPSAFVQTTLEIVKTPSISGYEKLKRAFENRYSYVSKKLEDGDAPNPAQLKAFVQDSIKGIKVILINGKAPKKIGDHLIEKYEQINFDFMKNEPVPDSGPPDFNGVVIWFKKMVAHYDYEESERIERDKNAVLAEERKARGKAAN